MIKTRRTLAFWLAVIAPLVVIGLEIATFYKNRAIYQNDPLGDQIWFQFGLQTMVLWGLLMMPLFVTLETALVASWEHRNRQWKHLFALPIPRGAVMAENSIRPINVPVASIYGKISAPDHRQKRDDDELPSFTCTFSLADHQTVDPAMGEARQLFPDPQRRPRPLRSKSELMVENALLRQQLIVVQRETKRPKLTWRDRALIVFLTSKLRGWKEAVIIVKPDTVLRWHRDLFRRVWKRKSKAKSKPGRPPLADELVALIKRMTKENLTWGAERVRGELLKLGIQVSKSSIQKYTNDVQESLPSNQTWATFVRNHANQIWACDFLQTYDIFFRTIFVFVIIEIGSRRIVHFGVTRHPTDQWTAQQLREATPFGEGPRFLIRDNDKKYGESFKHVASEIEVLKIPYRAPRANAYCERFIGSLRRECLDHVIILNEHHLHRSVKEHATYFNTDRPHQRIDQRIPGQSERPEPLESPLCNGKLVSQPVLNGLHHTYSWAATQSVGHGQAQRPTVH